MRSKAPLASVLRRVSVEREHGDLRPGDRLVIGVGDGALEASLDGAGTHAVVRLAQAQDHVGVAAFGADTAVGVAGVGDQSRRALADLGEGETSFAIGAGVVAGLAFAVKIDVGAGDRLVVRVHDLAGELEDGGLEFDRVEFKAFRFFRIDALKERLSVPGRGHLETVATSGRERADFELPRDIGDRGNVLEMHAAVAGPEDERGGGVGDGIAIALDAAGDGQGRFETQCERAALCFEVMGDGEIAFGIADEQAGDALVALELLRVPLELELAVGVGRGDSRIG